MLANPASRRERSPSEETWIRARLKVPGLKKGQMPSITSRSAVATRRSRTNIPIQTRPQGPDQEPTAKTQITRFESGAKRSFAIADLTPAYAKYARQVSRGIALLNRDKVLVQDELQADKPLDLWWFMHTQAAVKIEDDGRTASLQQAGAQLRAQILSPAGARFQVMNAEPLPTSPHPEKQAKNDRIRKLAIHLTAISDTRLAVLLVPKLSKDEGTGSAPKLSALSEW